MPQNFPPPPSAPSGPPSAEAQPQQGQAGAGQEFGLSQMGGAPPESPAVEQNAGILDALRMINLQVTDAQTTLDTIANQFPGAAEPVRKAMEALEEVNKALVDVLTGVLSQAQEQQPMAPKAVS